jgi:nicotinamide mononucleotide (NMN) deamidase PncC
METMMQACHKAGCTPEQCEQVMGTSASKACCADTAVATETIATPQADTTNTTNTTPSN